MNFLDPVVASWKAGSLENAGSQRNATKRPWWIYFGRVPQRPGVRWLVDQRPERRDAEMRDPVEGSLIANGSRKGEERVRSSNRPGWSRQVESKSR